MFITNVMSLKYLNTDSSWIQNEADEFLDRQHIHNSLTVIPTSTIKDWLSYTRVFIKIKFVKNNKIDFALTINK